MKFYRLDEMLQNNRALDASHLLENWFCYNVYGTGKIKMLAATI
jgi:hypothetical protein